ncbi:MAG: hypothetical protein WCP28_10965 [Actinomycetes bacterium]
MSELGAAEQGRQLTPAQDARLARAKRLNDRAFACAFIGVFFVPVFVGGLLSIAAILLGVRSRREGRALGTELSKSPVTFGIIVTAAWMACWLPLAIILLT